MTRTDSLCGFDGQGPSPYLDLTVHTHFRPNVSCNRQGLSGTGVNVFNPFQLSPFLHNLKLTASFPVTLIAAELSPRE